MTTTENTSTAPGADRGRVVLEGRHLVKEYPVGERRGLLRRQETMRAVDDVSIELVRGRVTALVGQSGSGKSTLGRMLARLIPTTSGQILLEGQEVPTTGAARHREYVGDVQLTLQDPFASLNPLRRIAYTLGRAVRLHQRDQAGTDVHERCVQLLERVGLTPAEQYLDRFPHELSSGQSRLVSLALALARPGAVLVLDEPEQRLDPDRLELVIGALRARAEAGTAIVLASHSPRLVGQLADRRLALEEPW